MSLNVAAVSKAVFLTSDRSAYLADINVHNVYSVGYPERLDGLPEGIYRADGDEIDFDVIGSSSTYFDFLEHLSMSALNTELAKVRNQPALYTGRPFAELLIFSDNEGAIGPITSRKLANDFAVHYDRFKARFTNVPARELPPVTFAQRIRQLFTGKRNYQIADPSFLFPLYLYPQFQSAFELASDDGFVIFQ